MYGLNWLKYSSVGILFCDYHNYHNIEKELIKLYLIKLIKFSESDIACRASRQVGGVFFRISQIRQTEG